MFETFTIKNSNGEIIKKIENIDTMKMGIVESVKFTNDKGVLFGYDNNLKKYEDDEYKKKIEEKTKSYVN